tara:strand:- start:29 stop:520 length:492 start_codon:yes stop_codon:yes gene_type:complete
MPDYKTDRIWSDKFIDAAKEIIGPHLLNVSSFEVDTKEAADFVVVMGKNVTIACRLRRPGYAEIYPWDFTIRTQRDTGVTTELSKIVDGWGDWLFYGHIEEDKICRWLLVDLNKFRAILIRDKDSLGLKKTPNGDGTYFVAVDVRKCPDTVIASSHPITAIDF